MFPCREYLQLAEEWSRKPDEAHQRCAVSRAYYACFHRVKEFAEQKGESFGASGLAHDEVSAFLNNNPDRELQLLGTMQARLKRNRRVCDYEAMVRNVSGIAAKSLLDAGRIFEVVDGRSKNRST